MSVNSKMKAIADAIRAKTGKTGILNLDQMASDLNSIPTKAATTITPSISNQTIAAGTYLTGTQTIIGDTDLKAENIKKGVNIFGVAGSYDAVELNFQVVGGTTEPVNRTENMIWVNTDTPITGYYFRAEQPGNMANGEVCIFTDTNGSVSFNALEKGNITIYPVYAKQMVSGSLVDVTAQIWQDGKWVDWAVYLYCAGEEYEDLTGGWFTYNWQNRNTLTLTRHETHLNAEYSDAAYGQGWLSTAKQIDLTDIDTIYLTYVLSNGSANVYFVAATAQTGVFAGTAVTTDVPAFLKLPGGSADKNTVALDVSGLSGSYYVKIGGPNGEYHGMGHVEVDIYSISLAR